KRNDPGLKTPAGHADCQELSYRERSIRSARRGPDNRGMASAQIVTLTLDEANAHDRKQQRVNQGHRQDQREGEIFRFVQSLRYLLIRDTQHLPKTSRRVTIVFQSGEGRATIAHWPIGQAHFDGEELMRVLLVHPSPLMYSEIYLRLEP